MRWSGLNVLAFHPEAESIMIWLKCLGSRQTGHVLFRDSTFPICELTRPLALLWSEFIRAESICLL
jgi:hypothetical protein